jgi:hypothetical protein
MEKRRIKLFENYSLINRIKQSLLDWYDYDNWNEFVDNQELGQCQSIVNHISSEFSEIIKVFGEIQLDESYLDDNFEEQYYMVHHWIEYKGQIYDFSKGTLKSYIDWSDVYEVEVIDDYRYNAKWNS